MNSVRSTDKYLKRELILNKQKTGPAIGWRTPQIFALGDGYPKRLACCFCRKPKGFMAAFFFISSVQPGWIMSLVGQLIKFLYLKKIST